MGPDEQEAGLRLIWTVARYMNVRFSHKGMIMGEPEAHLTETEASGGKKLGAMRYVLGISLGAVVLIFGVLLVLYR